MALVILDLDDTLVDTSHVYWLARTTFVKSMESRGLGSGPTLVDLFESVDAQLLPEFGFSPGRYRETMLRVYREVSGESHLGSDICREIGEAANIIFTVMPKAIPGASRLLRTLSRDHELALVTRGEADLQMAKINHQNWNALFKVIRVVSNKDESEFQQVISTFGEKPSNTWVVGDSVKSDMNPGLAIGANCVLFLYKHPEYRWVQEHTEEPSGRVHVVNQLEEIPALISRPARLNESHRS